MAVWAVPLRVLAVGRGHPLRCALKGSLAILGVHAVVHPREQGFQDEEASRAP